MNEREAYQVAIRARESLIELDRRYYERQRRQLLINVGAGASVAISVLAIIIAVVGVIL